MRRTHLPIITALGLLVAGSAPGWCNEPYPKPLADALRADDPGFVARVNWQDLRRHPVVTTALELAEAEAAAHVPAPATLMVKELVDEVGTLGLADDTVAEIWMADGRMAPGVWFRSNDEADGLLKALRSAGWEAQNAENSIWKQPLDEKRHAWALDKFNTTDDPDARERFAEMIDDARMRIIVRDHGWLQMLSGYDANLDEVGAVEFVPLTADDLAFPRTVLLDSAEGSLVVFAVDMSKPDPSADSGSETEDSDADTRDDLRRQLRSLESSDDALMAQIGDIAGIVAQTDSAVVLDLDVRRVDGGDPAETERFLQMLLLGARFAIAPTAPNLDRELGDTIIQRHEDGVLATASVSNGTLIDTLHDEARRRSEAARLRAELEELEDEDPDS